MFILFGTKGYREVLGVITLVCQFCGQPAAQRLEKWTTKFTLFFIPLFRVSTRYGLQCSRCATESQLPREEAERLAAASNDPRGLR